MLGHWYIQLLAPREQTGDGGGTFVPSKRKGRGRSKGQDELDRWLRGNEERKPAPIDERTLKRVAALLAEIDEARRGQAQAAARAEQASALLARNEEIESAKQAKRAADEAYAAAVLAESEALRKLKEMDIAFVAAMLIEH